MPWQFERWSEVGLGSLGTHFFPFINNVHCQSKIETFSLRVKLN